MRIDDRIDIQRDLLLGLMDVHLATIANRQNETMQRLAVVATVFLPLTFLTGFFGQNFGWLVNEMNGFAPFAFFGLGGIFASAMVLVWWFRQHRLI